MLNYHKCYVYLYIRVDLTVPQIGVSTHIAELVEQSPQLCAMQRIIELDPSGAIQGAATPKVTVGMASAPEPIVPHPDTYADFPDITSTPIDVELFRRPLGRSHRQVPRARLISSF